MLEKKISLYWVCQLLGWGSAAVYWSYYQINDRVSLITGILSVIVPFLFAIGYTHLYRNLAHARGWVNFPIRKLVPILFLAWISISALYTGVAMSNSLCVYGKVGVDPLLGMLTGGMRYAAIWLLAFHLYHFSQYRSRHELMQVKGEMLNLEAQYRNLNTELNPHFLFNALNSIKALTIEDPVKARMAVDYLSDILRQSIHVSQYKKIPLASEIERVKSYLELEKFRFEERLNYEINIDQKFSNALLPPLALLNLVENAVKHGVEKNTNSTVIRINVSEKDTRLNVEVINSGKISHPVGEGVGIKNTKERIGLLYGGAASLSLKAIEDNLIQALLILPIEYE